MTEHVPTETVPTADGPTLTTRQGHPVHDNQNQRTIGARGPATLENYQFLEKISHFDRERIAVSFSQKLPEERAGRCNYLLTGY